MSDRELCWLSLAEASALVRTRKISPIELTTAVLQQIDTFESEIGAFVSLLADSALDAARQAEQDIAKGNYRGVLHGIPITLKDLIHVRGVRTTAGTQSMSDFVSDIDATVVKRLVEGGAILIGKVQLDELAMGPTTTYHFGVTRNPWDTTRLTWGSSSGSAASVAAGFCYASIGTDTSGSIRGPAAACGVVGFKPTYGRVSRHGIVPLSWSQDCVGPLTRTVTDCALVMSAIVGQDSHDATTLDCPPFDYAESLSDKIKGCKIGVPSQLMRDIDPEIANAVQKAIALFENAGAEICEFSFGYLDEARTARAVIGLVEAAAAHHKILAHHSATLGPNVRMRLDVGSALLATDYIDALRMRSVFEREFHDATQHVDVIVTPTSPKPVPRFDEPPIFWSAEADADRESSDRFRWVFNLVGAPAISLPCGFNSSGLPIGLQIAAKPMADDVVLQTAFAYEARTGWHKKHSPVARARQEALP